MRIAVMGSGGVDGYFGALVRAGFDVTFITQGEHLAAIRREGLRYGAHWATFALAKSTRPVSRPVMQGVVAVGRAKGIQLDPGYAADPLAFCDSPSPDMTSSMRKDLQRGNRLVDWLSGSVVRLGKSLGVPTPVDEVIVGLLASVAAGSR